MPAFQPPPGLVGISSQLGIHWRILGWRSCRLVMQRGRLLKGFLSDMGFIRNSNSTILLPGNRKSRCKRASEWHLGTQWCGSLQPAMKILLIFAADQCSAFFAATTKPTSWFSRPLYATRREQQQVAARSLLIPIPSSFGPTSASRAHSPQVISAISVHPTCFREICTRWTRAVEL